MSDVSVIILAAGLSRRMEGRNKLLLPVNGVPMVRYIVDIYSAVTTGPVCVVTGHDAMAIQASLAGSDAEIVYNPDFAQGQQTSVTCGLRAVRDAKQILIGLGDQPFLTCGDLKHLLAAQKTTDPRRISIPMLDGRRGNPIVIPGTLRKRVLALPGTPGCKAFTRTHPEHVQFHALPSPGFYADVDAPDDYDALTAQDRETVP